MAEAVTMLIFSVMLLGCIAADISVLYALSGGLICFCIYTLYSNYSVREMMSMVWRGVKDSRTILLVFVLIGFLTASWRASGTIPCIVYYSVSSIVSQYYLVLTFILCCIMSLLTGTSFGTVSTMGVICAGVGRALGISDIYIGGVVLSGIYFGEQCSPMSSSSLLVCELTGTNIYTNIIQVFKKIAVPLAGTAFFYLYLGKDWKAAEASVNTADIFLSAFNLDWFTLIPAVVIVVFSALRIKVEITMLVSVVTAGVLSIFLQEMPFGELVRTLILGYHSGQAGLSVLIDGGGLLSMMDIGAIVAISSAYFGIFSSTKLLYKLKLWVKSVALHTNTYFATIIVAVVTCAISCNQTLASMLTYEMTKKMVKSREELAVNLETSVIVIAGLIPWSIACAFPLSVVGAPKESLIYAVYLYLVPGWMLWCSLWKKKRHMFLL